MSSGATLWPGGLDAGDMGGWSYLMNCFEECRGIFLVTSAPRFFANAMVTLMAACLYSSICSQSTDWNRRCGCGKNHTRAQAIAW